MGRVANVARHRARRLLVQALYQWQMGHCSADEVDAQFLEGRDTNGADCAYFSAALRGLAADLAAVDAAIKPLLQRSLAMVDPVERAIVRLAAYELLHRSEVPARVVINEAVELAHEFGSEQGHRFVNGLVDRLAHRVRGREMESASRRH